MAFLGNMHIEFSPKDLRVLKIILVVLVVSALLSAGFFFTLGKLRPFIYKINPGVESSEKFFCQKRPICNFSLPPASCHCEDTSIFHILINYFLQFSFVPENLERYPRVIDPYFEIRLQTLTPERVDSVLMSRFCTIAKSKQGYGEQRCDFTNLDSKPANETRPFVIEEYQLSAQIPFRKSWGTYDYKLPPVWQHVTQLGVSKMTFGHVGDMVAHFSFGPLEGPLEGGGLDRVHHLYVLSPLSTEEVILELKKNVDMTFPPKIIFLQSGLTAVQYEPFGLGVGPTIIVLGDKYNYALQKTAHKTGDFDVIEDVANSIQLISE